MKDMVFLFEGQNFEVVFIGFHKKAETRCIASLSYIVSDFSLDASYTDTYTYRALINAIIVKRIELVASIEPDYALHAKLSSKAGVIVAHVEVAVGLYLTPCARYLLVP